MLAMQQHTLAGMQPMEVVKVQDNAPEGKLVYLVPQRRIQPQQKGGRRTLPAATFELAQHVCVSDARLSVPSRLNFTWAKDTKFAGATGDLNVRHLGRCVALDSQGC